MTMDWSQGFPAAPLARSAGRGSRPGRARASGKCSWFSMRHADFARADLLGEMPDPHDNSIFLIGPLENQIEQIRLPVLKIAAQGISAQVRNLYHAGQLVVDE